MTAFRHPIAIDAADIDHMGHVNNAVYLKWVQEAVIDYWSSVAPPSAVAQHLWVALKHEITFLKPTFLQDNVVAEVIAERVQGARAFFRTVVRRGDEVLSEMLELLVLPRRRQPPPSPPRSRHRRAVLAAISLETRIHSASASRASLSHRGSPERVVSAIDDVQRREIAKALNYGLDQFHLRQGIARAGYEKHRHLHLRK